MTDPMNAICEDLMAETDVLGEVLADLALDEWDLETASMGWTIRDQVSHLIYFDEMALVAINSPEEFKESVADLMKQMRIADPSIELARTLSPEEMLDLFDSARTNLVAALSEIDAKDRIVWYGPAMGALSFATARLMETWAHGIDVFDALNLVIEPTERLRHVAHIGVRARPYAYATNGLDIPPEDVRVELSGPGGDTWTWGDADAENRITGTALDFALLVVRRRHPNDLNLEIVGPVASEWAELAQAFAGPPGPVRAPSAG